MAAILTEQQIEKVRRNRKESRPKYFNAVSQSEVIISSDFEAFLIILDEGVKESAIQELKKSKSVNNERKDRDELLSMAYSNEVTNAVAVYNEVNSEFTSLDSLVGKFKVEGFETVPEVGQILFDLQNTSSERILLRDRMQHLQFYNEYLKARLSVDKTLIVKEIDSWIAIITQYKGLN